MLIEPQQKYYENCFLGIPIPEEFEEKFKSLLRQVKDIDPNLTPVDIDKLDPHITIYYLDKQDETSLSQIAAIAESSKDLLKGTLLKIGKMGYFRKDNPFVIFLDVNSSKELTQYYQQMVTKLTKYFSSDKKQEFHPHMTVARMENETAQKSFRQNKSRLSEVLNNITWEFQIKELVVYGIDPADTSKSHKRLYTITIEHE
jgi:2'-5' RNA ligase